MILAIDIATRTAWGVLEGEKNILYIRKTLHGQGKNKLEYA